MLRLLPETRRLCCPACLDVELTLIAACDGARFLACAQCLRRFDADHERKRAQEAPAAAVLAAFKGATAAVQRA